jgi:hypothetical protein
MYGQDQSSKKADGARVRGATFWVQLHPSDYSARQFV